MNPIKTIPDFPRYGITADVMLVSFSSGKWRPLKQPGSAKQRYTIYGEKVISLSAQKFVFCATRQISPLKFMATDLVVSNTGEILSQSEVAVRRRAAKRESLSNVSVEEAVDKLMDVINKANYCIAYLHGNASPLLSCLEESRKKLIRRVSERHNKQIAEYAVAEAELNMFEQIRTGNIYDPIRWIYKSARGIAANMEKTYRPLSKHKEFLKL